MKSKILTIICGLYALTMLCGFGALTLVSCDDRYDSITGFNTAPVVYFNGSTSITSLEGQVKTSLKHGNGTYTFVLNATDSEKQPLSVAVGFASGNGKILVGGVEQSGSFSIASGATEIQFKAGDVGEVVLNVTVFDSFGANATGTVKLNVFANLLPVAAFTWSNKKLDGPYYIEFDASTSVDQDQDVGGGIQMYRYTIKKNGAEGAEVINTDKTIVPYNLRGPGGYDVTLEVYDNDGGKSAPFKPAIANQVTVN